MGYVVDQTGNPISGVRITATSPTQIGGTKVTYTDVEGAFNLRALIPGTFEVRASAPNLPSLMQKDVKVGITSAAELNLMMEVKTAQEQVTVVQKAPLVSTTKPNVTEEFDKEFIEALPHHTRDNIHREMLRSVPARSATACAAGRQPDARHPGRLRDGHPRPGHLAGDQVVRGLRDPDRRLWRRQPHRARRHPEHGDPLRVEQFEFEFNATADADQLRFFRDNWTHAPTPSTTC